MAYTPNNPNGSATSANSQPVVIASDQAALPLPTGAATAAKQPAIGTAGTPSTDVLTVQGASSGTALKVDASATTQPVSGTVTANAGTNLNTSALATSANQTNGTQQAKLTNGTTTVGVTANNELYGATAVYQASPPGTYTDGQRVPLLADNYGQLKVVPVGTGNSNITQFGGTNISTGTGTGGAGIPRVTVSSDSFTTGQTTMASSRPVTMASDQSVIKTKLTNDIAQATGNITTATSTVTTAQLTGVGAATVQISGTYAGVNITFEASIDNTNWVSVPAFQLGAANPVAVLTSGALTNNTLIYNVSPLFGVQYFRVRATAWTSGTAAIIIQPSAQFATSNTNAVVTSMPTTAVTQSGTWTVRQAASTTSSGVLIAKVLAAAATTPVSVKTTAGQVYGYHFVNNATTTRYVRFFNVSSAPTMGTTSPTFVLPLPPSGGAVLPPNDLGIPMTTGIFYSITAAAADLDNSAPAANDVVGTIWYI